MENYNFAGSAEAVNRGEQFTTYMESRGFEFVADEAPAVEGSKLGPAPGDYLCMALASCKAMTLRMYVKRKEWKVDTIRVKVNLVKGEGTPSGLNTFQAKIDVTGSLDEEQLRRMQYIARACPISRLLMKHNEVLTKISLKASPTSTLP